MQLKLSKYVIIFRNMSTLNSISSEPPNETDLQNISSVNTTANQESCNTSSKSVKLNLDTFGPQIDQLFNVNGM